MAERWQQRAGSRVRALFLAALAGWGAAMAFTLPMQFVKIQGNATGDRGELLWSFSAGAVIWCLWSLAFTGAAALLGGLPLVLLLREEWLLRRPLLSSAVAAILGWSVVLVRFEIWEVVLPEHFLPGRIFFLYSLLFSVDCGVAAAVYLLIRARNRKRHATA